MAKKSIYERLYKNPDAENDRDLEHSDEFNKFIERKMTFTTAIKVKNRKFDVVVHEVDEHKEPIERVLKTFDTLDKAVSFIHEKEKTDRFDDINDMEYNVDGEYDSIEALYQDQISYHQDYPLYHTIVERIVYEVKHIDS